MSFNRELLNNLVRRNGDLKVERILTALRPLAEKHGWDVFQLQEVAIAVSEIIHQSEIQLSDTVDELLRDLVNNGRRI